MAQLTPAQRAAADAMIARTFESIGAPPAYIQPHQTVEEMYAGILPPSTPKSVASGTRPPTAAQSAAIRNVPSGSYIPPKSVPINDPRIPYGSAYYPSATDGRASGAMLQQLSLAGYTPGPAIPAPPNVPLPRPRPGNAPTWMDMAMSPPPAPAPNVPLPLGRPGYAPSTPNYMDDAAPAPVGANPGMGGAMIGDGAMAPGIAPQGPPPAGIAPTIWAGDNPQQQGGPLNITVRGGKQPPPISSALKYTLANAAAQQAAKAKQATATGTAGGYQYENGQKVGYAPIAVGRGNYTPANGAAAYALSNLAGQQAAQQKQATATGQTGTTIYQNGQKVGNVGGGSAADAYAAAVKKNNSKSGSTSSGQSKTASDGSSWAANW